MSYKNTLIAVNAVLDFLKSKVPQSAEMVAGLLQSLQSSQVTIGWDQVTIGVGSGDH